MNPTPSTQSKHCVTFDKTNMPFFVQFQHQPNKKKIHVYRCGSKMYPTAFINNGRHERVVLHTDPHCQ